MAATTRPRRVRRPGHRLTWVAGGPLTVLLVLGVLSGTAPASTGAAASAGSSCSGFGSGNIGCANTLVIASTSNNEGSEAEEELEQGSGEEAASAEAEAEEASSGMVDLPANRTTGRPSNLNSGAHAVLSQLRLTPNAMAALTHHTPLASTVGFSFTLSTPAKVRVTLVEQTGGHGHKRWAMLPDSLTLNAGKGRVSRSLTGHNRLSAGRYRLTVKPLAGRSRSIYLSARR